MFITGGIILFLLGVYLLLVLANEGDELDLAFVIFASAFMTGGSLVVWSQLFGWYNSYVDLLIVDGLFLSLFLATYYIGDRLHSNAKAATK